VTYISVVAVSRPRVVSAGVTSTAADGGAGPLAGVGVGAMYPRRARTFTPGFVDLTSIFRYFPSNLGFVE